ncbi:MAG: glycosyltransferase family 2 protein [Candidatus Omnitrophica bacterium]|nr:glycosyltransferase family 2 protein [Candidatus Omnitrophota bacterium]
MINGKKVVVIMPAYNAEKTLEKTYSDIPKGAVDEVIVVDDKSNDNTVGVAKRLGLTIFTHDENKGYGANQKTCYKKALESEADIIIMIHPDYQYTPKLIPAMISLLESGEYDIVLGSRILAQNAIKGGMPVYKYIANRFLTLYDNIMLNQKLSEYHTGLRAFSRKVLETLPLLENSDDFVFDNQILVQAVYFGFRIGEIACPAKYANDSSSINFTRSTVYGLNVLKTGLQYVAQKGGIFQSNIFKKDGKKLL